MLRILVGIALAILLLVIARFGIPKLRAYLKAKEEERRREEAERQAELDQMIGTGIKLGLAVLGGILVAGAVKELMKPKPTPPPPPEPPKPKPPPRPPTEAELALARDLDRLDSDFDWAFSSGEEYYTLYDRDWVFQHFRRRDGKDFGMSIMGHEGSEIEIDHYNRGGEHRGFTNEQGERVNANGDVAGGDLVWPLYRQYIPFYRKHILKTLKTQ